MFILCRRFLPLVNVRNSLKNEWEEEGEKKKLLNETSLSKSQMRGNYSSSDYETVGIIEIRVEE